MTRNALLLNLWNEILKIFVSSLVCLTVSVCVLCSVRNPFDTSKLKHFLQLILSTYFILYPLFQLREFSHKFLEFIEF